MRWKMLRKMRITDAQKHQLYFVTLVERDYKQEKFSMRLDVKENEIDNPITV